MSRKSKKTQPEHNDKEILSAIVSHSLQEDRFGYRLVYEVTVVREGNIKSNVKWTSEDVLRHNPAMMLDYLERIAKDREQSKGS